MKKFERLGVPGCITLIAGVHINWDMCPTSLLPLHKGKEGKPTRAFNVASDCNRRIHHVHGSEPGARNDKTMARYDAFMQDIRHNRRYGEETFQLYDASGQLRQFKGAWALTDGGYHRWIRTQCPLKTDVGAAARWSKRGESIRKPAECVFGSMKKRWRILKGGMRFKIDKNNCGVDKTVRRIDNVVKFCAMLHNMILVHNDHHTIGEREDDWTRADLSMDEARIAAAQHAAQGAHIPHHVNNQAVGNDVETELEPGYWQLRDALVTHFTHQWDKRKVEWLKCAYAVRGHVDTRPVLPPGHWRGRGCAGDDEEEVEDEEEEEEEEEAGEEEEEEEEEAVWEEEMDSD